GAFQFIREKTVTCYNGIPSEGCGECPACRLRNNGLNAYLQEKEGERI
ncbi:MAG TPA: 7-cyano-7-deazaguanine synthase, partial [Massilibacterium sp.]|nr:7-cyano-7-deazaguanine synthase [Massilibacterium sp.]